MSWPLRDEPKLEIEEIQGHILIGFGAAEQALGAYTAADLGAAAHTVADWAAMGRVTSAAALRPRKGIPAREALKAGVVRGPWVTIAVSHRLLAAAGAPANFDDELFSLAEGMSAASSLNDPAPARGGAIGADWVVGGPGRPVDVLVVAAAGSTQAAEETVAFFTRDAEAWGEYAFCEPLTPMRGNKEHFGFRDGISQPALFGIVDDELFEENRLPDSGGVPYAAPGQELIWPGEFIFGYSRGARASRRRPGAIASAGDAPTNAFARNGSLLVYRRLAQDVAAFRDFCSEAARSLGIDLERLQALLVGRHKNGIPVAREPSADPKDQAVLNDFTFLTDDMARACPLSAHIRKVNPRLGGSELDNRVPRILRRGAPFGRELEDGEPAPAEGRGLAFIGYQSSITDQFAAVSSQWMANPIAPNNGGGHDLLVGQPEPGTRRFLDLPGGTGRVNAGTRAWVRMTGGAFLFAPSLTALRDLAGDRTRARRQR